MREHTTWAEALEELLAGLGSGPPGERLFRALGRMADVRAVALWTRVGGTGWLRTKSRGPEAVLPPGSVVEAYLEGRLEFEMERGRKILAMPGGRDALAITVDAGFDPDLIDALALVVFEAQSSSPREMIDALATLLADDSRGAEPFAPGATSDSGPLSASSDGSAPTGLGDLFRAQPEEDSDAADGPARHSS